MHGILSDRAYRGTIILGAIAFLIFLLNIDFTAVNMTFVVISKEMGEDINTLQWMLSGYVLAWAATVVFFGKMADIYGKRRLLLWGVFVFMVGSILCGVATEIFLLIGGRIIQGLGGAMFVPPLYALVFQEFPEERRGMAMGMIGVGAGIGLAVGPSFSSFILSHFGWRWIYLINAPLCLFVQAGIILTVHKEPSRLSDDRIALKPAVLLSLFLVSLMYGINQIEVWGFLSKDFFMMIAVSTASFILFSRVQHKMTVPFVPWSLFKNKVYLSCFVGFGLVEYNFTATLFMFGLYFQNILGFTVVETGVIFLYMTIVFGMLSYLGGHITDRFGLRLPALLGLGCMGLGCCLSLFLNQYSPMPLIAGALMFIGAGLGLCMTPFNKGFLEAVDPKVMNTASGVFNMGSTLGCALGIVISSSILVGVSQYIAAGMQGMHMEDASMLHSLLGAAHREPALLSSFKSMTSHDATALANNINIQAMRYVFGVMLALTLIAFRFAHGGLKQKK